MVSRAAGEAAQAAEYRDAGQAAEYCDAGSSDKRNERAGIDRSDHASGPDDDETAQVTKKRAKTMEIPGKTANRTQHATTYLPPAGGGSVRKKSEQ